MSDLLLDSYSEANVDSDNHGIALSFPITVDLRAQTMQAFQLSEQARITSVKFYLKRESGTPSGTFKAVLSPYLSGTFGANATTDGTQLSDSSLVNVSSLTTSYGLYEFVFNTPYLCLSSTTYFVGLYGTPTTVVYMGSDGSSPSHAGNISYYSGTGFVTTSTYDLSFYLYGQVRPKTTGISSITGLQTITW